MYLQAVPGMGTAKVDQTKVSEKASAAGPSAVS